MKLRSKILITFTICITVTFGVLFVMVQNRMGEFNSTQTESFNQQIVQSKANELGAWLYGRVGELRMLSQYYGANQSSGTEDDIREDMMREYVNQLNLELKDLYGNSTQTFLLVNSNGVGWTKDNVRIDVSEREYFIEAVAADTSREYTISKTVISKIDGIRTVFLCYPIRNDKGEKIFYLIGAITAEKLDTIVSAINIFDGSAWIMDRYGRVICKSNNREENDVLDPANISLTKTASMLQNSNYGIEQFHTDNIDGELIYSSIPYSDGWKLCVLAQNEIIYAGTNDVSRSIFMLWLVLIFSSFILCIMFTDKIVKPINQLQSAMKEVEKGNFVEAGNRLLIKNKNTSNKTINNKGDEIQELRVNFQSMVQRIKGLMESVVDEQKGKRKAELRALQAQINPHFLYNTLDTLQWKALEYNATEVAEIVNALSGFFRFSLSKGKELITWNEEVEHAYYYLFIQQIRYRDKLDFDIELDEEIESYNIVKIILQPLIENAIYHGIKPSATPGIIKVKIKKVIDSKEKYDRSNELIKIVVSDNGVGMTEEKLILLKESLNNSYISVGYGVKNVHERLKLTYGEEYSMNIDSEEDKGTTFTIYVPLIMQGE